MKQLEHEETNYSKPKRAITLLCDGITLPANIGGIFRLADAFGVEKVIFGGAGIDTTGRKVKQVSRSTHKWVKHTVSEDILLEIDLLKASKYKVIALEITDQSQSLHEFKLSEDHPVALVIGSENFGVSQAVLSRCDEAYHIPLYGKNSSMNVTNALAVGLFVLQG